MGKSSNKKRKNRAFKSVTGERIDEIMDTRDGEQLLNESFRHVLQTAKDIQHDSERAEIERKERDIRDRFLSGWTPLFARFRQQQTQRIAREHALALSQTLVPPLHSGVSVERLNPDTLPMYDMAQSDLDRANLSVFAESAFAMTTFLLVNETAISDECLPQAPQWIEYAQPKRLSTDASCPATSAFWFHNPFSRETQQYTLQRSSFQTEINRTSLPIEIALKHDSWFLQVFNADLDPIALLRYYIQTKTWSFVTSHRDACPYKQCTTDSLGDGPEFLVACERCQTMRETYCRVLSTSLLIVSGAFRASDTERDGELDEVSGASKVHPGNAGASMEQREDGCHTVSQEEREEPLPVTPLHLIRSRPLYGGYEVIEFDASIRKRTHAPLRTRRVPWHHGREVLDLAQLNGLDIEIDDNAVVSVDLAFSGITRQLRSAFYVKKRWETIHVRDFRREHVKMTFAAYKRRLRNKRVTKVVASRFIVSK